MAVELRHPAGDRTLLAATWWVAFVGVTLVAGGAVAAAHPQWWLDAAPFAGRWAAVVAPRLLVPAVVAVAVVRYGPDLAARLPWRRLLIAVSIGSLAWAVSLAWARDPASLAAPLETRFEYLAVVPAIDDIGSFVDGFVEQLPSYPTHVKGHPPGAVVALWTLDRIGLGGPGWAATFVLVAGASGAAAVLVALGATTGRASARRAAPFVALLPAAVWMATSMDAVFAASCAWAVAATAVAAAAHRPARLVGAGLCWGGALLLTYGAAPLLLSVPVLTRRRASAFLVVAGVVAALALAAVAGFSWLGGLDATRDAYLDGIAPHRSYPWFLWLNAAALAIAVGPAVVAGFSARPWPVVPAIALAAVAVAAASGMSKGEVERIWLPFALLLAGAAAAVPAARARRLLGANAVTGLALSVMLASPW